MATYLACPAENLFYKLPVITVWLADVAPWTNEHDAALIRRKKVWKMYGDNGLTLKFSVWI